MDKQTIFLRAVILPVVIIMTVFSAGCSPTASGPSYTPTTISFNPQGTGFYDMPFPNDFETDAQGHPLLTGFPNPFQIPLLDQYLETARTEVVGFGTNAPLYFHFTGSSLLLSTLPQTASESITAGSSLYLADIDPASSRYGALVPVIWYYEMTGTDYMPSDTLAVSPLYGFPLSGATKYALILTNAVKDKNNHPIAMPGLMRQALLNSTSTDPVLSKLIAVYRPLRDYVKLKKIPVDTIGSATVFTTQDPTKDVRTIQGFVSTLAGLGM